MTTDDAGHTMMHIGELAEKSELSLRTIRHYDEIGLLKPSGRTTGGFRLYTEADLARLLLIRRMKPLGYSLEQMGDLLKIIDGMDVDPTLNEALQDFYNDAQERRAKLAKQLAAAEEFISQLQGYATQEL